MISNSFSSKMLTALPAIAGLALAAQLVFSADDKPRVSQSPAADPAAAEAQIWALEQAYWEFNRDAKREEIVATWHDRFLGWPDGEPKPIDKAAGIRYVRENYAEPASHAFEIERAGIRILGNVAVNHYTVYLTSKDGKKRSLRITHTLVREVDGWKVLGGMSAGL